MKRDFDLIRKILLAVESNKAGDVIQLPEFIAKIPDQDVGNIGYNIELLIKAGLIEGETFGYPIQGAGISGLTWTGHDFLDNARSDTVWSKTKTKLKDVGGSASLEIFKALLDQTMKSLLGLT